MEIFNISGKKAIVTGGGRGLGKAMAEGLRDAGADVVIIGTTDKIFEVADALNSDKAHVNGVKADFRNHESVAEAFNKALLILGDVDILVNNSGTQIRNKCEDYKLDDWLTILDVNLTSAFILTQLAGREMLKKGSGRIINIASLLSYSGGYNVPAYAASKGGIAQMTKAFSNEWASRGINVNAIAPGYMATDNTIAIREDPVRNQQILDRIPAKRWGNPKDMVGALIFLASDASEYVHGSVLLVDGGWMGR